MAALVGIMDGELLVDDIMFALDCEKGLPEWERAEELYLNTKSIEVPIDNSPKAIRDRRTAKQSKQAVARILAKADPRGVKYPPVGFRNKIPHRQYKDRRCGNKPGWTVGQERKGVEE